MNFKKALIVLVVFLAAFFLTNTIREIAVKTDKTVIELPKTSMEIEYDLHNFGSIHQAEPVQTYFSYTNSGDKPLKISDVLSPCGCTVPKWSDKTLAPGATDSLLVEFDAAQPGAFSKSLHVKSNSEGSPHVFYIRGFVESSEQ